MSLEMALVGTGFSYLPERRRAQGARVAAMIPHVRDIRRYGSAALDLCLVGCGRLDAYFEEHLNSWDIAAGVLIASEAGAVTSDLHGGAAVHGRRRRGRRGHPRRARRVDRRGHDPVRHA